MKRKIRIFSHIAIIALSVCMFAFGVYAASIVSITTSGTVSFNATDVYARVTRTLENIDATSTYNTIDITYNADTDDNHQDKFENESLKFESADKDIVMRFTVENLASDRYIYATFTETATTSNNVTKFTSSLGGEIAIAPTESKEIAVFIRVTDPNSSASTGYNYTLTLKNTTDGVVLDDTLANYTLSSDKTYYTLSGLKTTATASTVSQMNTVVTADTIDPATLTNIVIPDEINEIPVKTIGASAFAKNTVLKNVTIPNSVTLIGDNSFDGCTNLSNVNINNGSLLNKIGTKAFIGCSNLTDFNFPSKLRTFGQQAFDSSGLVKIYLPDGMTSLGSLAVFTRCNSLVDLKLPNTLKNFGGVQAFGMSENLKSVVIPDSIETINYTAFNECASLKYVTLPEEPDHEILLDYCCFGNTAIEGEFYIDDKYNLPYASSFTNGPFVDCRKLTGFRISDTNSKFIVIDGILYQRKSTDSSSADYNVPLKLDMYPAGHPSSTYVMPATITDMRRYELTSAVNLAEVIVEEDNTAYSSVDGILYNKAGTSIVLVPEAYSKTVINLSSNITNIATGVFGEKTEEIYMPSKITSIAACAMQFCYNLTKVGVLGQTVEEGTFDFTGVTSLQSMGHKSLQYCEGMKVLKVGASFNKFDDGCFQHAVNLEEIYITNTTSVVTIVCGSYVNNIAAKNFNETKLKAIYVPDDLVDDYKDTATYPNWAPVADLIKPLSEAPAN